MRDYTNLNTREFKKEEQKTNVFISLCLGRYST